MKADAWIIVKIKLPDETIHKVVAGWNGSYTQGSSWRVNSGIKNVEYKDGYYLFHGFSGSCYKCHENNYGLRACNEPGLGHIIQACKEFESEYEIMDKDIDWLNYKFHERQ